MAQIAGGCFCGKVRYSANAEPVFVGVCHCKDCQKFTGTAFFAVVALPKAALKVEGDLTTFTKIGDSGQPSERTFCPICGSGVTDVAAVMPDVVMIGTGTLDDPSLVKPTMQIYCDSEQPWAHLQGIQGFPKMPG